MIATRPAMALALLTAIAAADGAAAQDQRSEGRAALFQSLADCRKLTDDTARLACYDKAAAVLDQAEAKGDIVVVDREQARKVRRQTFGFTIPSISLFERGEPQEELENVSGVVKVARINSAGKWVIQLEDGAVWAQIDDKEFHKSPKSGMPVKIRQAALGSYLMTVDNGGAFRAKRVE